MPSRTERPAPPLDQPPEEHAITGGLLRGIVGSLAGFLVALSALFPLEALGRRIAPSAGIAGLALAALLPGACASIAITWQCRCSPWRRALAVVGPALILGLALVLAFLVLIGFQAHADWAGYPLGSGIVFALAGAIAAACLAPALRLGSVRAGVTLVLAGAVAFMIGGLVHGAIVSLSLSPAVTGPGPKSTLVLPVGFALALACGWGGLGAGAQRIQARSRRARVAKRATDVTS